MHIESYKTILHCMPAITLPITFCATYCVIRIRVKAMSPVYKRLLLCYVILSCLAELSHTVLFTPVILAPLLAGYNVGIVSFIPPVIQYTLWLAFSTASAMVMELQFHFRFNSLLPSTSILHLSPSSLQILHLLFIAYVLITALQIYFTFSDSLSIRLELSNKYLLLADELLLPQTVAISPEFSSFARFFYYYVTISIACHGVLLILMISYSFFRLSSTGNTLSTATKKSARYYLKCLLLQFSIHSTVLYVPFFLMFYLQYMMQILERDITNIGMIFCSMNGSCSILTMLFVMTTYRNFLVRTVACIPPPAQSKPFAIKIILLETEWITMTNRSKVTTIA